MWSLNACAEAQVALPFLRSSTGNNALPGMMSMLLVLMPGINALLALFCPARALPSKALCLPASCNIIQSPVTRISRPCGDPLTVSRARALIVKPCLHVTTGQQWGVPEEAYVAIETMLPTGKGQFLELWAAADDLTTRPGWLHVAEAQW